MLLIKRLIQWNLQLRVRKFGLKYLERPAHIRSLLSFVVLNAMELSVGTDTHFGRGPLRKMMAKFESKL